MNQNEGETGGTEGTPPAGGESGAGGGRTVDYETYMRVVSAKQGLENQVGALKRERDGALEKAATADTLAAQVEEWKAKAADAQGSFQRFRSISTTLGTAEPEAIEAVEWQYNKLQGDDKPELDAWLANIKEKPEEAPLVLRPFLTGAVETPPAKTRARERTPSTNPPNGDDGASQEKLRRMREHAAQTGDWTEYEKYRAKRRA